MIDLNLRRRIAEELLQYALDPEGFGRCPGLSRHTTRNGRRDFLVMLDGAPTGTCVHASCTAEVAAFNHELRSRIGRAERNPSLAGNALYYGEGVAPLPDAVRNPKRPPFDPEKMANFASRCPRPITLEWLRERSPFPVPAPLDQGRKTAEAFISALYEPGESVLIFTNQTSQGDFLAHPGKESYRLGNELGVPAVRSALPAGGREGVWFLTQPVTGQWCHNSDHSDILNPPKLGRRHWRCVTCWRYALLESDVVAAADWLRVLVQLPFPIAAIYTSGGKSIHALLRVDAHAKCEWDSLRDAMLSVMCPLGADPAALTGVRLSRLPGCFRHGATNKEGVYTPYSEPRLQELAWLNPKPAARPILDVVRF